MSASFNYQFSTLIDNLPISWTRMDSYNCEKLNKRSRSKQKEDQLKKEATSIESLPSEILLHILSKLPVSSLLQFKFVSQTWRTLTHQHPHFVDFHNFHSPDHNQCLIFHSCYPIKNHLSFTVFHSSYTNEESTVKKIQTPPFCQSTLKHELDVIGSCNGLLCLSDALNNGLHIYNPFTRENIDLPDTDQYPNQYVVFGFGFSRETKEYKVVKIIYHWPEERRYLRRLRWRLLQNALPKSEILVLTLGSSTWRSLGETSHLIDRWPETQVILKGRLHWETRQWGYHPFRYIVSFDLLDEKFREVPKPDSLVLRMWDYLVVLRNCLCVVFYVNYKELEIWVMKEYNVKESWVKELHIRSYVPKALQENVKYRSADIAKMVCTKGSYDRVLGILRNGEILLEYKRRALVLYDPNNGSFKDIFFKDMPDWFQTVVHFGNLHQIDTIIANRIR